MPRSLQRIDISHLLAGTAGVAVVTVVCLMWLHQANTATVSLSYLLLILFVATSSRLWVAVTVSILSMLCLNFFFLPPVGRLTISDPENWVALVTFLAVSLVASRLSAAARDRAAIAIERAKLVEDLKQAEISQRSAELKSTLLASLAHDLRTPLAAIRVAASNLHATWLTDAQRAEQSEIILAEVERLRRLFQNILEMTRIDAGAVAPELQWVHPLEIVEAAQGQVEYTIRGYHVDVQNGHDLGMVFVDPRLTSAALAHLLENAAQYSPPGSKITVTPTPTDEGLLISVRDEGPGIVSDELPHLFERFFRGREARRNTSGTGMGLSITKGLIASENGRVWARNVDGGGSEFCILVPTDIEPAAPAQE